MAYDRVVRRLHRVTASLRASDIPYAVVGGNAVATWVTSVDPAAVRATKDVDLLVNRHDLARIDAAMSELGFKKVDLRRLVIYLDPEEPSKRAGVHLVWADEKVWPSDACATPTTDDTTTTSGGYLVIELAALVRMKLTSFRLKDQVHLQDMIEVGLIDDEVRRQLPEELRGRLTEVEAGMDNPLSD